MDNVAIIDAHSEYPEFSGKLPLKFNNKPILWWAIHNALKLKFIDRVVVSVEDEATATYASQFPGIEIDISKYAKTSSEKVYRYYTGYDYFDNYILVPVGEPALNPKEINQIWSKIQENLKPYEIATLYSKFQSVENLKSHYSCKVVSSHSDHALYFSRSIVPSTIDGKLKELKFYKRHVGVFIFPKTYLKKHGSKLWFGFNSAIEDCEALEQNRFLDYGASIKLFEINHIEFPITNQEQMKISEKRINRKHR